MIDGKVIENKRCGNYFFLKVETEKDFNVYPGQFIMLGLSKDRMTLKPFSIMGKSDNKLELLIKIAGDFTRDLSNLKINDSVLLRGAYGVPYHKKIDQERKYVLIGGGSGIAPLIYFSSEFPFMVKETFYGSTTSDISKILDGVSVLDESLIGRNIVDIAAESIAETDPGDIGIILCGPKEMMKYASQLFKRFKIYVSLEERMGCGIGMCMGCPVKTIHGIKKVCKDGPIFDLEEVIFEW
jgi:dihydroorotate dehydrogenase electron transfer subunit